MNNFIARETNAVLESSALFIHFFTSINPDFSPPRGYDKNLLIIQTIFMLLLHIHFFGFFEHASLDKYFWKNNYIYSKVQTFLLLHFSYS